MLFCLCSAGWKFTGKPSILLYSLYCSYHGQNLPLLLCMYEYLPLFYSSITRFRSRDVTSPATFSNEIVSVLVQSYNLTWVSNLQTWTLTDKYSLITTLNFKHKHKGTQWCDHSSTYMHPKDGTDLSALAHWIVYASGDSLTLYTILYGASVLRILI